MKIEVIPGKFLVVDENHPAVETLYEDLPKKEQYWRRESDFPNFFYDYNPHLSERSVCRINASRTEYKSGKLVTLSVEDTIELVRLVKREADRMRYGIFVMINGVKTFFPGFYYGALQWGKMFGVTDNDGYGQHREYQQTYSCARQLAIITDALDGYYCHKAKKTGITQLVSLFLMIESIIYKQFTAAAMSKSHETAKKANFAYYRYALKNLPPVLRPKTEQKSWQNAVQKIELKTSDEFSVENTIAAVATTKDGLDGLPPTQRVHIDEPPKFPPSVNIEEVYTKTKEQVRIQQLKIGIIEMTSYPPEEDTPAFKWCKKFYAECCKDGEDGWPINRMLPIFIGVIESSNGTFDIYGKPDKFKALKEEQAARSKCTTAYQLQARKRQYPITAKEGWESGGSGSVFNNIILTEQEATLEEEYNNFELNFIYGNLEWTAGRFSPVRFVPLTLEEIVNGKIARCRMYCTMQYMEKNTNLCFKMPRKIKMINGEKRELLQPPDDVIHPAGIDPVDYAFVSEMGEKQSDQALTILDIEGNLLFTSYFRSEDPDDDIDFLCMAMIFWGIYGIVEGNRKNAVTSLEKELMYYFILIRHPNGEILPYAQKSKIKHISSTKDIKAKYIELIIKRIKNSPEQFKSIEEITQLKEFDPLETQLYDKVVSRGLAEVAVDAMQTWIINKKSVSDKYAHLGAALAAVR